MYNDQSYSRCCFSHLIWKVLMEYVHQLVSAPTFRKKYGKGKAFFSVKTEKNLCRHCKHCQASPNPGILGERYRRFLLVMWSPRVGTSTLLLLTIICVRDHRSLIIINCRDDSIGKCICYCLKGPEFCFQLADQAIHNHRYSISSN